MLVRRLLRTSEGIAFANGKIDHRDRIVLKSLEKNVAHTNLHSVKLAYLGDAVWALHVRQHFLSPPKHISKYHEAADHHVTAEFQAGYYDQLVQSGKLSALETEVAVQSLGVQGLGLRSRFKGKEMQEQYRKATAFESLLGYLSVQDDTSRLQLVLQLCTAYMDKKVSI